jgi:hypothetical protein
MTNDNIKKIQENIKNIKKRIIYIENQINKLNSNNEILLRELIEKEWNKLCNEIIIIKNNY